MAFQKKKQKPVVDEIEEVVDEFHNDDEIEDYDGDADYRDEFEDGQYDYSEKEEYYYNVEKRNLKERLSGYVSDTRNQYREERSRYEEYFSNPDDHTLFEEQLSRNEKFVKHRILPIILITIVVIVIWALLKFILK